MTEELNDYESRYFTNRTVCDILEEMRTTLKTLNFSYLAALIEEVQFRANKMEAGLSDKRDLRKLSEERSKLKAEVNKLRAEKKQLLLDKLQDSEEN